MNPKNRKAVSPVIATVIIVAVAIAIAIAVAFWMTGLIGTFTKYEKLTLIATTAEFNSSDSKWYILIKVRNDGLTTISLSNENVFVNDKSQGTVTIKDPLLDPGESTLIRIAGLSDFSHGAAIEVKIVTSSGNAYTRTVVLP